MTLAAERWEYLGDLAHLFGVRPWEYDQLLVSDFRRLIAEARARRAAIAERQRDAGD